MNLSYLSVASGISAETLAWRPLGWRARAFAQFDPDHKYKSGPDFASVVLAHHYPDVPNLGDMNKFAEWPDYAALDVLAGGTPCQTYSVAGLGAGLDDPRGDLALVYAAIARRYRPRWVVWENTGGVLSNDRGRSFASILGLLSGRRVEVPSGGWRTSGVVPGLPRAYGLAWRVLDTQFVRVDGFGRALPQRRRRVFVVGYIGDWRRAAAVLLEREGLSGNPAPSRRPGQVVAGAITRSFGVRGGVDEGERGTLIPAVANPLTARMHKGVNTTMDEGQTMIPHPPEVAVPLLAGQNSSGGDRQPGMDGDTVHNLIPLEVSAPLTSGSNRKGGARRPGTAPDDYENLLPIAFNARQDPDSSEGVSGPVDTDGYTHAVAFKASHFTRGKDGAPSPVAHSLTADADKGDQDNLILSPFAPAAAAPLTAGGANTHGKGGYAGRRQEDDVNLVAHPIPFDTTQLTNPGQPQQPATGRPIAPARGNDRGAPIDEVAYPLTAEAGQTGKGDSANVVQQGWSVRRLMPVECERLQGVPDDFTLIPFRGKPAKDGPRYKVLGNMQSINVMRWIGTRIEMVEALK